MDTAVDRDELIKVYFGLGLTYKDLCSALAIENGIVLSVRHLKRILKRMGLRRRYYDNIQQAIEFIENELQESGQLHGYR